MGANERVTPQAVRDQNPGRALSRASMASLMTLSVDKYTFLANGYSGAVDSLINSLESVMASGSRISSIIRPTDASDTGCRE